MKNEKKKKIIELVENRCIETQEQLLSRLQAEADQSLYRMKQERKGCDEGAGSAERA